MSALVAAPSVAAPSVAAPQAPAPAPVPITRVADDRPPISPGRAFFYSAILPGLGQAALDRKYAGAAFFFIEAFSLSLVYRTADDLRLAKAFLGDSVPLRYVTDPATGGVALDAKGNPRVDASQPPRYTADLVRTRKLQLEDWLAVVIFNHLISGADAYVAANLWDLPRHIGMRAFPAVGGAGLAFSVSFR